MSDDFLESPRLNDGKIIYKSKVTPKFSTSIVTTNSGIEQRQSVWLYPLAEGHVGDQVMREADWEVFLNFFMTVGGQAIGFRWKDWLDYKDNGQGIFGLDGLGNGGKSYQAFKRYAIGGKSRLRKIRKPVVGTMKVFKNGVDVTASTAIDYTTGIITLQANATETDALTWTGEFDLPVRFTTDQPLAEFRVAQTSAPGVVEEVFVDVDAHPIREIKY